jgi:DNA polymerase-4
MAFGYCKKLKALMIRPLFPYREQKSIGTQTTFNNDSIDLVSINYLLTSMVMELAFELRQKKKQTACVTVTVRYSTHEDVTKQATIPYTALDGR